MSRENATKTADGKKNPGRIEAYLNLWKHHPGSAFIASIVWLAALITMGVLIFLVSFIVIKGVRHLTPDLFALSYNTDNVSLLPALINTLIITVFSLLIAVPLGIFAAIFLVEYANKGSKMVNLIRITAETLQGIPSIIYGLFGLLFFCTTIRWGLSLLSGSMTLVIMILPLIIRTTEEALLGVPDTYREASFGLGAGKLRTIFRVVLPSAIPDILSGVVLATGRIVGEHSGCFLHGRFCGKGTGKSNGVGKIAGCTYVCAFNRRIIYGSGVCDGSCTACIRTGAQWSFCADRAAYIEGFHGKLKRLRIKDGKNRY